MNEKLIKLFRKELIRSFKNDNWCYSVIDSYKICNDKLLSFWNSSEGWKFEYKSRYQFLLSDVGISRFRFYFLRQSAIQLAKKDKNKHLFYKTVDVYFKDNKAPLREYKISKILDEDKI